MREFKINKYLSLRLEDGETNIYINQKKTDQCKYLLVDELKFDEIPKFIENFESVDEATENADHSLDYKKGVIPPETEFWAHCSNLQVWAENNYDTRLLHMSIAFSLLKELAEAGDVMARRAFKEEIAKRLGSGYPTVVDFLVLEGFDIFLTQEERITSVLVPKEADVILKLEELTGNLFFQYSSLDESYSEEGSFQQRFVVKNNHVVGLWINWAKEIPNKLPGWITELKMLKRLYYTGNKIEQIPKSILELKSLEVLYIDSHILEKIPRTINKLKSLKFLDIRSRSLKNIPETIGELPHLKSLSLGRFNNLTELPDSIGNLKKLEELDVSHNKLKNIPDSIFNLKNLKSLNIEKNNLITLSESIGKLKSLEKLNLSINPIKRIPKSLIDMEKLQTMFVDNIPLSEYNKSILKKIQKKNQEIVIFGYTH